MFYITVKDRYMHKLGIISNDIPGAIHFRDDKQHEFLAEGAELFDLTIEKYANGILQENIGILSYGNILSFYDEYNVAHVYMIQHPVETRRAIQLQCSSLNLELIHEEVGKYSAPGKMSFFQYLNEMGILVNSSMQLNVNEVSDKLLTLTFDSQQTKLARLLSIVNSFDAECEMIPILTTQGLMDHIELNVYKANDGKTNSGVGRFRNDVLLTIGKDIQDITRDVDGTNLFNAVTVTGQNGETFTDINTSILNDNGVEEYYIRSGSSTAYAPISKMKYPATENEDNTDGWTRRDFQTQYTTQADLAGYAIRMLKSYAYPVITYNLSMTTGLNWDRYKLKVGDTIKISDMKFDDQGLILSARVTEKVTSRANPNLNSVTLSNFVRRQVQTSNDLQNLIKQQLPYNISILTDNGTVLKKAGDSTTLSVYMSRGQAIDIQVVPDSFVWTMNGEQISTGDTLPVSYENLTKDTNLITVQTSINGDIVGTSQITISKLTDGEVGRSIIGAPKYKYMTTTTQVAPTDSWDSTSWTYNLPTMTSVNKYLWQITQILYNAEPTSSYSTALISVYGDQGNSGYFMSLSPDTIVVATDGGGQNGDYSNANATASVFHGTTDDTNNWTISVQTSIGVTGTLTGATYKITGLTENSSYVDFKATNKNDTTLTITKRLIVTKAKSGLPGKGVDHTIVAYALSSSSTVMPNGDPSIPSDDWKSTVPAALPGQYIWTATIYVYTDTTKSNPQYTIGIPGITGANGTKVVSVVTQYSNSTDLTIPTDWYATIALLNNTRPTTAGMYLWTRTTTTYDDPNIEPTIQYINAYWGKNGINGTSSYNHVAWANNMTGTDGFTTVYPNLNLLDGTKDFSGTWVNLDSNKWVNDGVYKNLVVKKRTTQWQGLYKIFTAPIDGTFTFSAYVKASGDTTSIYRYGIVNGVTQPNKRIGTAFDWLIDSVTVTLQAGQTAHFRYEIATANTDAILWTAGHKWEQGLTATSYMPSSTEVTADDWPKYRGEYSDNIVAGSTDPSKYTWTVFKGSPGVDGQDPTILTITKPLLIIQADAEGNINPTTGYANTDSVISLTQGGNNLLPVQVPSNGIYANGSYSLFTTAQSVSLTTTDIDSVSMTIKIGKLQNMDKDASSASINYLAVGTDYYGNPFSQNIIQTVTKTLNSYGGRIFIMYSPTNDLTLEDMSVNPQYNSLYIGTAVGSSLYSPTKKAQYIWTEYATDNIVYSPTVPLNPLNGERWINNDPNSPNYNQQMVYNGTTQTWVLDMFSANNIFSNRIYSEGGDFKWIKSDNYSETNHIGTFINLETGEIELGSSGFDKNGNPIQTSDTSLNRYLSWKDLGDGNKALVIGDVTSGSSLQLTPDRMSFYNGDTEVMYITNQILRINQAILLQGLYIGEHKMESRGKHTVFVFTGGV